ncbi:MAG TPA: hypothetical protein PLP11_09405 [Bacteroidales bacterium]|nr:hypothetical protein [Bacteroidales bacterium]HQP04806.1 hypothetical protein [Bacteroidales bacterium]
MKFGYIRVLSEWLGWRGKKRKDFGVTELKLCNFEKLTIRLCTATQLYRPCPILEAIPAAVTKFTANTSATASIKNGKPFT